VIKRKDLKMATKVDTFDFSNNSSEYDWSTWFDGSIYKIVQGEDFTCKLTSMRSIIHGRASARDLKVKTSVLANEKAIVLQASKK
jgi:hypothetical protein